MPLIKRWNAAGNQCGRIIKLILSRFW